jgi:hypothetical protein
MDSTGQQRPDRGRKGILVELLHADYGIAQVIAITAQRDCRLEAKPTAMAFGTPGGNDSIGGGSKRGRGEWQRTSGADNGWSNAQ